MCVHQLVQLSEGTKLFKTSTKDKDTLHLYLCCHFTSPLKLLIFLPFIHTLLIFLLFCWALHHLVFVYHSIELSHAGSGCPHRSSGGSTYDWLSATIHIRLSVVLYVQYVSACLSVCPSVYLSVCPSVCLSVCLPVCLSVGLSVRLPAWLSICMLAHVHIYAKINTASINFVFQCTCRIR